MTFDPAAFWQLGDPATDRLAPPPVPGRVCLDCHESTAGMCWRHPRTYPAVDVDGYRPATSVVHRQGGMVVWHHADDPCELCPDPVNGDFKDVDP